MRLKRGRLCAHSYVLAVVLLLGGCQGSQLGSKRWGGSQNGQGSGFIQKNRAVVFDPYPLNDIGPEVVGGRPRGFMNPLPEAKRNRLTPASVWSDYAR